MGIVQEAFVRLFPDREFHFSGWLKYSGKFKPYNAAVRRKENKLTFNLSKTWKGVSEEITIGLVQYLLLRILRRDRSYASAISAKGSKYLTLNMQLYDDFIRNVSEEAVSTEPNDPMLTQSFDRVNQKYFFGLLDKPGLQWGAASKRKLACYSYQINTIIVSTLFKDAPDRLLDYLMYHEMLHKKLKFTSGNGRTRHHSAEFKKLEASFDPSQNMEGELTSFLRSKKRKMIAQQRSNGWRRLFSFSE